MVSTLLLFGVTTDPAQNPSSSSTKVRSIHGLSYFSFLFIFVIAILSYTSIYCYYLSPLKWGKYLASTFYPNIIISAKIRIKNESRHIFFTIYVNFIVYALKQTIIGCFLHKKRGEKLDRTFWKRWRTFKKTPWRIPSFFLTNKVRKQPSHPSRHCNAFIPSGLRWSFGRFFAFTRLHTPVMGVKAREGCFWPYPSPYPSVSQRVTST